MKYTQQEEWTMSKSEELLRLERDLDEQPELREKLEAEIKRIAETKEAESDGEAMAKAAATLGYTITLEELERATADLEKLDDDELDAAGGNGGIVAPTSYDAKRLNQSCIVDYSCGLSFHHRSETEHGHDRWCPNYWHCYTLKMHTSTERKDVACLADYQCMFVNKKDDPNYDYYWVNRKEYRS
jgi:hypothetical protein